jgi:hypothetical protein
MNTRSTGSSRRTTVAGESKITVSNKIEEDVSIENQFDRCDQCGIPIPSKSRQGLTMYKRFCKGPIDQISKTTTANKTGTGKGQLPKARTDREKSHADFLAGLDHSKDKEQHHITLKMDKVFASKCDIKLDQNELGKVSKKPTPKLPHPNDKKKWLKYDNMIYEKLITTIPQGQLENGNSSDVLTQFMETVYDTTVNLGGVRPKKTAKPNGQNIYTSRKLAKHKKLKKELRKQLRKMKQSNEGDFKGVYRQLKYTLKCYSLLRKSEESSKMEASATRERQKFMADPYKYGQQILKPSQKGKPTFSKNDADNHNKTTYGHPDRKRSYNPPPDLPRPPTPSFQFQTDPPTNESYDRILYKKRNGSSAGMNGNSYLVYKRCKKVRHYMYCIFHRIWKERLIPFSFRIGWQLMLAKSDDTSKPSLMRGITILNSEARIYWSGYEGKLSSYMLNNNYIRTNVQKAFVRGVAGCIEHTTIQSELFNDARRTQRAICATWLDLANAYGSVAHLMIAFALRWYHVPEGMIDMLMDYYSLVIIQLITDDWTSDFFSQNIGVLQGCTAATMVFNVSFQLLLDIQQHLSKGISKGFNIADTEITIPKQAYADDLALIESFPATAQISTDAFVLALKWSRTMEAKPSKCRSLAFRKFYKGEKQTAFKAEQSTVYSSFDPMLKIRYFDNNGEVTKEEPIKFIGHDKIPMFAYLGHKVEPKMGNKVLIQLVGERIKDGLEKVDASLLKGTQKAWIVDKLLCTMQCWDLMIHNIAPSTVNIWHALIHAFYRKWVGLAKAAEGSVLYRPPDRFGLGFTHLTDMAKKAQVIKWHIMKYSEDTNASNLYQHMLKMDKLGHLGTGRKSSPRLQLEDAESQVDFNALISNHQGKAGLGLVKKTPSDKASRRKQIIEVLQKETENKRLAILHTYEMQNGWMHFAIEKQMYKDLTWKKLLYSYNDNLVKFVVNGTLNTLPTPDNLRRWKITSNAVCGLCGQAHASLKHVLAGCPWVYNVESKTTKEHRYTWRHNCVLLVVAQALVAKVAEANQKQVAESTVMPSYLQPFVKAGQCHQKKKKILSKPSILDGARDWVYDFDLPEFQKYGQEMVFPHDVFITNLRIDGYILSREKKICILGPEITAPMDDNVIYWHTIKSNKYREEAQTQLGPNYCDWTFHDLSLEAGALGWVPPNVPASLRSLGFTSKEVKQICEDMTITARKCSYIIYLNRFKKDFKPYRLPPPTRPANKTKCGSIQDVPGAVGSPLTEEQTELIRVNRAAALARRRAHAQEASRTPPPATSALTEEQTERARVNREAAFMDSPKTFPSETKGDSPESAALVKKAELYGVKLDCFRLPIISTPLIWPPEPSTQLSRVELKTTESSPDSKELEELRAMMSM